jgi:hypothetical protein
MDDMKMAIGRLETKIDKNEHSIDRIVDVLTRELKISPSQVKP